MGSFDPNQFGLMTCTATSGSGSRIAIKTITTERQRTAQRGPPAIAVAVSTAAVPGTAFQGSSARPSAAGTLPAASGSGGRLPNELQRSLIYGPLSRAKRKRIATASAM